jgi:alanyl-tRNA synthetase
MTSDEIRQRFLEFFRKKQHKIVPSSSLIPDDPSVLLTTAGMQQFKKYFIGEADVVKDLGGKRAASIQKCFRTSDIDEVGDRTHLTFFEMLGYFSFGDYFKKETITWTFELLTEIFGINPERITATVFQGDEITPFDKESFETWLKFLPKERIKKGLRKDNFWGPAGNEGPCGAANEVYIDGVEVATLVFMEYYCRPDENLKILPQKGVDVGWGFERLMTLLNKTDNIFETDIFQDLIFKLNELAPHLEKRIVRILADHLRASIFLIADDVRPSNKEAGYVLRRLLRRILAFAVKYDIHVDLFPIAAEMIKEKFEKIYSELRETKMILEVLEDEKQKFGEVIGKGLKAIEQFKEISGQDAFYLYETFGLPFELITELAPKEALKNLSKKDFDEEFAKHQQLSRTASAGMFKSGLADTGEQAVKYHTATHLLLAALRQVLGPETYQKGSNITAERLRFDFNYPQKLSPEQIKKVEDLVNEKIKEDIAVEMMEIPKEEALKIAKVSFDPARYGDMVKIYKIGDFSVELCAGPHAQRTGELGHFQITKEEASSAGVRRIKAILSKN